MICLIIKVCYDYRMPILYIHTTESSVGGEAESDERWCHRSDIVKSVSFNSVSRTSESFWSHGSSFEVSEDVYKSDYVFLVIVRYYDGGTFGRTTGLWRIQDSFLDEKAALDLAKSIRDGSYEKEIRKTKDRYVSCCWTGYFAGLEDVEIHRFPIADKSINNERIVYH